MQGSFSNHPIFLTLLLYYEMPKYSVIETFFSIKILAEQTLINNSAFYRCSNVTSIDFPDSLITIEDYAIESCHALEQVVLREGLQTIGEWAFADDPNLTVTIPKSVNTIGDTAFGRPDFSLEFGITFF